MTNDLIHTAFAGLGGASVLLSFSRMAVGSFFAISGYHKLFDKNRHQAIEGTLEADRVPDPKVMAWVVPCFEFICGSAVALGLLAPLASIALIAIMLVALATDGLKRIPGWHPIDRADWADDLLYLPETLYVVLLLLVLFCGSGSLSLDRLILGYL